MRIRNGMSKLNNRSIYLIGYFFLILNQVLAQSQYDEMKLPSYFLKATRWALIFCFSLLALQRKRYPHSVTGLVWGIFLVCSLVGLLFFDGKLLLLILWVLVISSYKLELEALPKIHVCALAVGMVLVIGSSLVGILDPLGAYKDFDNLSGFLFKPDNMRYALGFINSNVIPMLCLYVYLYILWVKKEEYKWYYDLVALVVNYIVYLICGSRVCILLVFLAIALRWLVSCNKSLFMKVFVPGALVGLLACILFSLLLPGSSLYATPVVAWIDNVTTARITIMREVLVQFPITVFGHGNLPLNVTGEYLVMDNGYLALFVTRGWIIGLIFAFILVEMIICAKKKRDPYLLLLILVMIIANLVDNSLLHYVTFPLYILSFNTITFRRREGGT